MSALAAPRATRKADPSLPPHERVEQGVLAKWLRARDVLFHHSPNEGRRDPIQGRYLRHLGMAPGFPDIAILSVPKGGWRTRIAGSLAETQWPRGVAVELKRRKPAPSTISDAQRQWLDNLARQGWLVRVCYGAAEAIKWLDSIRRW